MKAVVSVILKNQTKPDQNTGIESEGSSGLGDQGSRP